MIIHYMFKKDWELTIPIGPKGHPTVIGPKQLETLDDVYFHYSPNGSATLTCPCDGITTPNTKYTRTELRELMNDGKEKAAWNFSKGTHTMKYTGCCTHLPKNKPQLVFGQVHDKNDDIFEMRFTGSHFEAIHNSKTFGTLLTNYKLGEKIDVEMIIEEGNVTIKVGANAIHFRPKAKGPAYFKLGAYVQSNRYYGDGNDFGEVIIDKVEISHT
jgi:poly(beta-D-mannuronate) lyase